MIMNTMAVLIKLYDTEVVASCFQLNSTCMSTKIYVCPKQSDSSELRIFSYLKYIAVIMVVIVLMEK